ncbi:MAG: FkbM family methyltransferase, partial [Actinobacteria bacterium]|nr:FkbM family methyltransferase [Actinomycetota bacterium]
MAQHGINVVFDVGANQGQYGQTLRALGFQGAIISFEPLGRAFRHLEAATEGDASWIAVNAALGEESGSRSLMVAGNSQSSSLLT